MCAQGEMNENKQEEGGAPKRQKDVHNAHSVLNCGEGGQTTTRGRADRRQKNAQLRAIRSNNMRLKRKLCTIEDAMRRDSDDRRGKQSGGEREGEFDAGGSRRSTNKTRRTGHADETGGNCKRRRDDMR